MSEKYALCEGQMRTGPLFDEPVRPMRREIVHAPPRLKTRGIQDIRQTADGNSPLIPTADPKPLIPTKFYEKENGEAKEQDAGR